jgi:NAD(P)-dependent dehydrogenase (short-subunit alcohol dehydrogenase family)
MRLQGKRALITGAARGIGLTFAQAYTREGARVAIADINIDRAREAAQAIEGATAVQMDVTRQDSIEAAVAEVEAAWGGIDILVNNAAHQATFKDIGDISDEEWQLTFAVNIHAMFYLVRESVPHMKPGSCVINTASVNSDMPNPTLLAYATTKGAIQNFTGGLAQMLADKGIRANAVAPGPIWTPLIPSTMTADKVKDFGKQVPLQRPGQPVELATAYVMLADPLSSYVSGATIAVTGGKPFI